MANERIEQIREMAVRQLESLQNIAGAELQGTSLELDLQMALASLKNNASAVSSPEQTVSPVQANRSVAKASEEDSFDPYEDEYAYADDFHDEDDLYNEYADDYEEEDLAPVVPNNFPDEEAYQAFLRNQEEVLPTVEDEETGEITTVRPDDVAGVIATENGFVEVGDLDGSLDTVEEILREQNTIRDEDGEELYQNEIETVPYIRVAITRTDENTLTEHQVKNVILTHPSSRTMINTFGEDYRVADSDKVSEKIVMFRIDNGNDRARKASQGLHFSNGTVQFAGHLTFPGVGRVYARALVD